MKQFVGLLLEMTHSQWMYPNLTLHHYAWGYLCQQMEQDIQREAAWLREVNPTDVPRECPYLLELSLCPSVSTLATHTKYWAYP